MTENLLKLAKCLQSLTFHEMMLVAADLEDSVADTLRQGEDVDAFVLAHCLSGMGRSVVEQSEKEKADD